MKRNKAPLIISIILCASVPTWAMDFDQEDVPPPFSETAVFQPQNAGRRPPSRQSPRASSNFAPLSPVSDAAIENNSLDLSTLFQPQRDLFSDGEPFIPSPRFDSPRNPNDVEEEAPLGRAEEMNDEHTGQDNQFSGPVPRGWPAASSASEDEAEDNDDVVSAGNASPTPEPLRPAAPLAAFDE